MFATASLLSLTALLFAVVSATPVQRSTCNPNAQGVPVSIQSVGIAGLEWGLGNASDIVIVGEAYQGFGVPNWYIRQSGQYPTSYFIT
ncbi:hypothetical protein F5880DRAFT_1546755 [Lentinula raphanica]|nr:hypothetical protein F5880DRAFT_1546755 [Lentinula raphanica]